jgi:hypothetical protein
VPWRNGVWKHRIVDGPNSSTDPILGYSGALDTIKLECAIPVELGKPLVGENGDSFVVSLRMSLKPLASGYLTVNKASTRRTGYNELWSTLWTTRTTERCPHTVSYGETITREPGWQVVSGYEHHGNFADDSRLMICLTACNPVARWRALIAIQMHRYRRQQKIMLRTANCCFQCALDQVLRKSGVWYLVL